MVRWFECDGVWDGVWYGVWDGVRDVWDVWWETGLPLLIRASVTLIAFVTISALLLGGFLRDFAASEVTLTDTLVANASAEFGGGAFLGAAIDANFNAYGLTVFSGCRAKVSLVWEWSRLGFYRLHCCGASACVSVYPRHSRHPHNTNNTNSHKHTHTHAHTRLQMGAGLFVNPVDLGTIVVDGLVIQDSVADLAGGGIYVDQTYVPA